MIDFTAYLWLNWLIVASLVGLGFGFTVVIGNALGSGLLAALRRKPNG